ncbi:hypothetical protein ONZ45_g19666 [Pleurotus djamor]|nr:hypothetical protein ONZ45_g19666 [Pleurotus djamor]
MVSSGSGQQPTKPSQGVLFLLQRGGLMASVHGSPQITSVGFQFLLHSPHEQLWDLLLQYLHLAEERQMDLVEVLSFLFMLSTMDLGRNCKAYLFFLMKLYIPLPQRLPLIQQAHDELGHKGVYTTRTRLLERFWWPQLGRDVQWYVKTCHNCQIRSTRRLHIPPTPTIPPSIFRRIHIDSMVQPPSNGFRYIVHARCALTAYPEWRALRKETAEHIGMFIFQEILCRWGAVEEIVTDNGTPFIKAVDYLAKTYGIHHIRISPYNSQANGIVERQHFSVREALSKACDGDKKKWVSVAPAVFWAERVSIVKATGFSPYYMVHGVEPTLPFDIHEATYLVPPPSSDFSTTDLIAY